MYALAGLPCLPDASIMLITMCDKRKLSYSFLENLRRPMLFGEKLRLVLSNNLAKMRRMRGCCGNYGHPGC